VLAPIVRVPALRRMMANALAARMPRLEDSGAGAAQQQAGQPALVAGWGGAAPGAPWCARGN
jgi:hypothetical protein